MSAAVAACVGLVGCSFPADYGGTRYQCMRDAPDECPPGYRCAGGFCEASSPGSDGGNGAEPDGGGQVDPPDGSSQVDAAPPDCPGVTSLQDDFSSNTAWDIASDGNCAVEFNGELRLAPQTAIPPADCVVRSSEVYGLDDRTSLQVVSTGTGNPAAAFGLDVAGQTLLFRREVNGLAFVVRENDVEEIFDGDDFVEAEQRFWAFSVDGDHLTFEASADGAAWTTLTDFRPRVDPSTTCVRYEISIGGDVSSLAPVVFDNLNIVP